MRIIHRGSTSLMDFSLRCIYNVKVEFNWDDANRGHMARHEVAPSDCEAAWNDPVATLDAGEVNGEKRWKTLGRSGERELIMIWTLRDEAIRIVTAWWVGRRTRK